MYKKRVGQTSTKKKHRERDKQKKVNKKERNLTRNLNSTNCQKIEIKTLRWQSTK